MVAGRTWFGGVPATAGASRRASAGLALVLLALALTATASSWYQARMIKLATASMATGDAYREARLLATAQKAELSHSYVLGETEQGRIRHGEIGDQLVMGLERLSQADTGMADDADTATDTDMADASGPEELLAKQRRYLGLADEFFGLLDAGRDEAAATLLQSTIDPLSNDIDDQLDSLARTHDEMNMMQSDHMNKASQLLLFGTPLVFGVGLALFLALMMITRSHRRHVETQARQDPLTGLPNRNSFHDRAEQALQAASRTGTQPTVLVLDLDGFKDVNDTLGHEYGDQLLTEVAKRLRAVVRDGADTMARLGGDEFAILTIGEDPGSGEHIAERITEAFQIPFVMDDVTLDIEASIGIATAGPGQDVLAVIRHADHAMYLAKEHKLGHARYDPDHDRHTVSRLMLLGALRRALDTDEIVLHYQPKVALDTGEMIGVEALARWQHPTRGLLPPAEFIPVLESTSLAHRFTAHVIAQALKQIRAWMDQGIRLPVAVNVSTRCLLNRQFPQTVTRLLEANKVPGELLCVEITENTVMADPPRTIDTLRRIRQLGVKTAIDDFGTGYSSMAYLKQLPIDELKVDRSFVSDMTVDPSNTMLVQSAIDLGHNLGLAVVAEGVENGPTMDALHRLGCDVAQGFYFARPLPATEVTALLDQAGRRSLPRAAEPRRAT
jgi:diguanylate cyclase (GGDEF)-like protein